MRIRSVRLFPFASVSDRALAFKPGLNVVLGPNETGKSTIYQAITKALFTPVSLTADAFRKTMELYVPVSGGDTARVALELDAGTVTVTIDKSWVRGNRKGSVRTSTAEGSQPTQLYSSDEETERIVRELLPVREATFRQVLLARQTELAPGGAKLEYGGETPEELGEVLRSAVMNTGGISVERFRTQLAAEIDRYFGNWDSELGQPKKGRGIENPYTKGNGVIIDSYYAYHRALRNASRATELERELDQINGDLEAVRSELERTKRDLDTLLPHRDKVRARETLTEKVDALSARRQQLESAVRSWNVAEADRERLGIERSELERKESELQAEFDLARRIEATTSLRSRITEIEASAERVSNVNRELAQAPAATPDALAQIRRLSDEIAGIEALTRAQSEALSEASLAEIVLSATAPTEITLSAEPPEGGVRSKSERRVRLKPDSEVVRRLRGGFRIDHDGLSIVVRRPSSETASERGELAALRAELNGQLGALGVDSVSRAESLARRRSEIEQRRQIEQSHLDALLGEETLESLRDLLGNELRGVPGPPTGGTVGARQPSADPPNASARNTGDIGQELGATRSQVAEKRRIFEARELELAQLLRTYDSQTALFELVGATANEYRSAKSRLDELPELPAGLATADDYFRRVDLLTRQEAELTKRHQGLRESRLEKETSLPDTDAESLVLASEELGNAHRRELRYGAALMHIDRTTSQILAESEKSLYDGFSETFLSYFRTMTHEAYSDGELSGASPATFVARTGARLSYRHLSAGTKDAAALSLRLAMAEQLLRGKAGVMIFDDPLVDMDPERRERASALLRNAAETIQLIILTCHPEHAASLGGNTIAL